MLDDVDDFRFNLILFYQKYLNREFQCYFEEYLYQLLYLIKAFQVIFQTNLTVAKEIFEFL